MKIKISKVDEKAKDNTDNRQNTNFNKKKNNLNLQLRHGTNILSCRHREN